jgi:hypothetical protein
MRACRQYRAKTKGKVERPIRYVRGNLFYGRRFLNDQDLDAQTHLWLENLANVRFHGMTGERPIDRFERDERAILSPVSTRPYHSLVLPAPQTRPEASPVTSWLEVERRPLGLYRQPAESRS